MLYGIAVVVIAAFIFLIVYNVKAVKSSKPNDAPKPAERKTDAGPGKNANATAAAPNRAVPVGEDVRRTAADPPAKAAPVRDPERPPQEAAPLRGAAASALHRQQSDEEYRDALRRFSANAASAGKSKPDQDEPSKKSKDEAYREGLRSLTKRD